MPKDLNGQQVGAQKSNVNNEPTPSRVRGRHHYRYNYPMYTTQPFGLVQPYMYFHTVKNDDISILSQHDLRTYEMRAPFMGNVIMNKMLVHVNMDAIYPRNWKLMMVPPVPTEEDVPDDIRALVNFQKLTSQLIANATRLVNKLQQDTELSAVRKLYIVKLLFLTLFSLQDICSSGSLLSNLNIHIDRSVFYTPSGPSDPKPLDAFFDSILPSPPFQFLLMGSFVIDDVPYSTVSSDSAEGYRIVSYRELYKLLYFSSDFRVVSIGSGFSNAYSPLLTALGNINSLVSSELINIEPVIAYQLACAQFHTNSKVDPVYSAELWLNNMESMLFITGFDNLWFEKDGVYHRYDVFNARVFDYICDDWLGDPELFTDTRFEVILFFLRNLFGFRKSLKYADYFTGASLRPYAGNDEELQAHVQSGSNGAFVSAIDTTRSIVYQRLMNKVNLIGSKLDDYLTKIFGGSRPEADSSVPQLLAIETFSFGKDETTNTSTEQEKIADGTVTTGKSGNITTSKLRGKDSFIRYNIYSERPAIIIGLCSFDIERVYSGTIDRFAFHYDRYDDFIPDLQFMGDQEVKLHEADFRLSDDSPIGYQLRHAEYKQKYGYAAGGFNANMLPGWAFIPDSAQMGTVLNLPKPLTYSGIRNNPFDFDIFFPSLTGVSTGTYFHFIIRHGMNIEANRDIIPTPEILV